MSYPAMSYDILNAHCIGARTLQDALAGLTSTERNGDFGGQTQPILNTYVNLCILLTKRGSIISSMAYSGTYILCGDIPLNRSYIDLIPGRYLQIGYLKWP